MVSLRSMSLFWGCPKSSTMQRILGLSNVNLQRSWSTPVMSNNKRLASLVKAGSPPKLLHKLVTLLLVQQQGLEVQRLVKCCPVQ